MSETDLLWIVFGLVAFLCLAPSAAARSETPPDRTLTVATLNRGDHARFRTVRAAVRDADLTALQEMYDQPRTLARLDRLRRFEVITCASASRYARANPVVYQPARVRLVKNYCRLLLPRRYLGPGAGPDWNMPKWLVAGLFEHRATGRRFWFGSIHNVPHGRGSQRRDQAALDFTHKLVDVTRWRRPTLIGGDWNAGWTDPSVAPIRDAYAVHIGGGIDWFALDQPGGRQWRTLRTWTRDVPGSDHDARYARLEVIR